jgi:hypothetical protein
MTLDEAAARLEGKALLDGQDAAVLRRIIYGPKPNVSPAEVGVLFKLNADAREVSPEWRTLMVDTVTDVVVRQQEPCGYVDSASADWLKGLVTRHPMAPRDEVEVLVHVLETADQTPPQFAAFVVDRVKAAALEAVQQSGRLDREMVELLRRVIFAQGGERNVAVTRHEAEALFDVNDAVKVAVADPAWRELFTHAVAAAVLYETPWTPDRATAQREKDWLADTSQHPFHRILAAFRRGAGAGAAAREGWRELVEGDYLDHELEVREAADEALEAKAEILTDEEARWLRARVGRVGGLDDNERALLAYLHANARATSPQLGAASDPMAA